MNNLFVTVFMSFVFITGCNSRQEVKGDGESTWSLKKIADEKEGPFFGQNYGAQRFDRLLEARQIILRFALGFGLMVAVSMSLLAAPGQHVPRTVFALEPVVRDVIAGIQEIEREAGRLPPQVAS